MISGAVAIPLSSRLPAIPRTGPQVRTGLDRILTSDAARLAGKRIGLLTHDAAITANGQRGVDAIAALPGVKLAALFAPEHGLGGKAAAGEHIGDTVDGSTGLPIYSLYGSRPAPDPAQLAGLDLLVIDLQDVGLRCYTYAGTAFAAMEAAAAAKVKVLILDRPNPLGGLVVEGPGVDESFDSAVTKLPVPFRHGLTLGELTGFFALGGFGFNIMLSKLDGWTRDMGTEVFAPGGMPFKPPSPNLRSPEAILAYAATVLVEGTNVSEGRGTANPFELIGAPWIDGAALIHDLKRNRLPGVRFSPADFTPDSSKHAGVACQGIRLTITDESSFRGIETGIALISALRRSAPEKFAFLPGKPPFFDLLAGRSWVRERLEHGGDWRTIYGDCQAEATRFHMMSAAARFY
jgi:uncharacterized protein YbbC (DUF1343 family)